MGRPPGISNKGLSKRGLNALALLDRDLTDESPSESGEADSYWAYKLMDWIEQFYLVNGFVPTVEKADEIGLKPDLYARWISSRPFREELAARGVFLPGIRNNLPEDLLSERQLAAIRVMTNSMDTRSRKQKLAQNEIEPVEWQGWLSDPRFMAVLNAKVEKEFNNSGFEAYMSLLDGVRDGDLGSTKVMLEMQDKWNSHGKSEQFNFNLNHVVTQIMEVIMEEVKDEDLLRKLGMRLMGVIAAATGSSSEGEGGSNGG